MKRSLEEGLKGEELNLVVGSVPLAGAEGDAVKKQILALLEERYGVSVDGDRFRVDYIYIASNLMPDITIVPLSGA